MIFGSNFRASKGLLDAARSVMTSEEIEEAKKMDPVGQADHDIDNDGDVDKSDEYLHNRRKAIKKSMKEDTQEQPVEEAKDLDADNTEKALKHDCATHVEHAEYGAGRCIPGMHTLIAVTEDTGVVTHYDVMFENDEGPFIVENVPVTDLKIKKEMNHGHKKKK